MLFRSVGNSTVNSVINSTSYSVGTNTFTVGTAAYFVANGNLGIGTSSPGNKLDVASPGSSQIRVKDGVTATAYYDFGRDASDGLFGFNGAQTTYVGYKWATNGTERMRIDSSGNVGIQTTSPSYPLTVKSSSAYNAVRILEGGGVASTIQFTNDPVTAERASFVATSTGNLRIYGTSTVEIYTASTERMRVDGSGNVRVGTAALATTATDGFLYVPTCAGTPTGTPTSITGLAPIVINTTNNKLYFYSGGAWRDAGP